MRGLEFEIERRSMPRATLMRQPPFSTKPKANPNTWLLAKWFQRKIVGKLILIK